MRNLILALLVIAGGVLVYNYFTDQKTSRVGAAGPDPEKRFQALLENGQTSAADLAVMCERYPQLAKRYLTNSLLRLDGRIRAMHLTGVSKNMLDLQFETPSRRPVTLRLDLQRYNNLLVADIAARHARYEIVGYEVLMFAPELGRSGKVIYRLGQRIVERGRFFGFGAADIRFDAE